MWKSSICDLVSVAILLDGFFSNFSWEILIKSCEKVLIFSHID
jgi:hypothetical protein